MVYYDNTVFWLQVSPHKSIPDYQWWEITKWVYIYLLCSELFQLRVVYTLIVLFIYLATVTLQIKSLLTKCNHLTQHDAPD